MLLTVLDHWTTYVCLRGVVPGWQVSEGNPVAAWLFTSVGLVPGLLIDSAITLGAVAFVLRTSFLTHGAKGTYLSLLLVTTSFAVINNLGAVSLLDLWP